MWRLDWASPKHFIRLGARAVELWRGDRSGLSLVLQVPLLRRGSLYDAEALSQPLLALVARLDGASASVVLESAFAPVLLADTGSVLTNGRQVAALLRHRFHLAYGGHGVDIATWKLRTSYRFGQRNALGFALPYQVEAVLAEVARSAKVSFTEWRPALDWSLGRFDPSRRWERRSGWWIWPEQDRSLILRLVRGRAEALNPAAVVGTTPAEIERSIAIEAARFATQGESDPIGMGRWQPDEYPLVANGRIRLFGVATPQPDMSQAFGRKAQEVHTTTA